MAYSINFSSFDMQLENFGVNTAELKEPAQTRIFRAWLEDWEKPLLRKNCTVVEAILLEKYKGLVMFDPDVKTTFTVHDGNLEFHAGRKGGWCLIGNHPSGKNEDDEAYLINKSAIDMIVETEQAKGVRIVRQQNEV